MAAENTRTVDTDRYSARLTPQQSLGALPHTPQLRLLMSLARASLGLDANWCSYLSISIPLRSSGWGQRQPDGPASPRLLFTKACAYRSRRDEEVEFEGAELRQPEVRGHAQRAPASCWLDAGHRLQGPPSCAPPLEF